MAHHVFMGFISFQNDTVQPRLAFQWRQFMVTARKRWTFKYYVVKLHAKRVKGKRYHKKGTALCADIQLHD